MLVGRLLCIAAETAGEEVGEGDEYNEGVVDVQ